MKKLSLVVTVLVSLFLTINTASAVVNANIASGKSLEVTVTGYSILYQMAMNGYGQDTNIRREWVDDNSVMLYLTDTCFCMLDTESKSDFANITGLLHTAAPETSADALNARISMIATITIFDSSLEPNEIYDLVTNVLPQKGEYTSDDCKYTYTEAYNVIMLLIAPR